ncbi:MAG TPA: TetR/AcrR family transcriptional regulator [Leptospiraceae bacterium]|nr:TetR/AcrR family transcriptional regulator [Leptospiraceae bacterium]HMY70060.1 TetR/AcrR family transcriptional regulator [Leptospiraceae bacterium]HMZ61037.1 TetR/AcrR family transcriptional regulator [Leptospiraceae bacterium]HNF13973.1 TetR/AcrR family transcriptional regulator [Leptospiraceae bacterium]HNI99191.1 TetR/AcrR family transcriptional regulator [Leptospiraceae bacterium]
MKEKPYHHKDLKNRIIKEALRILQSEGIHGLSLRKIAKKLGTSHAAPHRHFQDKNQLLAEISEKGFLILQKMIVQNMEHETVPSKKLKKYGESYIRFAAEYPQYFRVMFGENFYEKNSYPECEKAGMDAFNLLLTVISECMEKKEFAKGNPLASAISAWSAVHGLSSLIVDNRLEIFQEMNFNTDTAFLSEIVCTDILNGMLAKKKKTVKSKKT